MLRKCFMRLALAASLCASPAFAAEYSAHLWVKSGITGEFENAPGVKVTIQGKSATTNAAGDAVVTNLVRSDADTANPNRTFPLTATKTGLDTVSGVNVIVPGNGIITIMDNAAPVKTGNPTLGRREGWRSDSFLFATWPIFTDGWGVERYEVRWREEGKAFGPWINRGLNRNLQLGNNNAPLTPDKLHFIEVRAWGAEGLVSATATASARTQKTPTGVITSPADGSTVSGEVEFTSRINTGPTAVYWIKYGSTILVNNEAAVAGVSDDVATAKWDTRKWANGAYKLTIVVKDAEGNFSAVTSITVTVDNPVTGYIDGYVRTYAADGVTLVPVVGEPLVATRPGYANVQSISPTGSGGYYKFPPLAAGLWSVSIGPDDVKGGTKTGLQVTSGQRTIVNFLLLGYQVPSIAPIGNGPVPVVVKVQTNTGIMDTPGYFLDYDIVARRIVLGNRWKALTFAPTDGSLLGQWWDLSFVQPTHFVPDYSNGARMFAGRGEHPGARYPAAGAPTVNPGPNLICWNLSSQQDGIFGFKEVLVADQTAVLRMRNGRIVDRWQIPVKANAVRTEVASLCASQRSIFILLQSDLIGGGCEFWLERHDRSNLSIVHNSERLNFRGGLIRMLDGFGTLAVVETPHPDWPTFASTPDKIHWFRTSDITEIGTPITVAADPATGRHNRIMGLASSEEFGKLWFLTNRAEPAPKGVVSQLYWYSIQ